MSGQKMTITASATRSRVPPVDEIGSVPKLQYNARTPATRAPRGISRTAARSH